MRPPPLPPRPPRARAPPPLTRRRLESDLLQLLQEAGWTEQLRALCLERLRDPGAGVANYTDLRRAVDQEARELVPDKVRVEMVQKVLAVLRAMVDE